MEALAWIDAHWVELLAFGAALLTFISVIVRLTPSQADDEVLTAFRAFLERVSFLQPKDGRGVFSLPGKPAKRQDEAES